MEQDLRKIYRSDGAVYPSKGTACTAEEGRTRQEDAKASDINYILARVAAGMLPLGRTDGVYADVSQIGDLRSALDSVARGKALFEAFPASVRNAFDNDPAAFVEAFKTPEGVAKLRELKVVPETEETLADRREAAAEARADKRREERVVAKRVEEAQKGGPAVAPPRGDRRS